MPGATAGTAAQQTFWEPLERACSLYDTAFALDSSAYWAMVQFISLSLVLEAAGRQVSGLNGEAHDLAKLWTLTEVMSIRDSASSDHSRRAWALGNLVELYMLAPLIGKLAAPMEKDWQALAESHARHFVAMARPNSFEIFSTRRQIARYADFYAVACPAGKLAETTKIAAGVLQILPEQNGDEPASGDPS